MNFKYLSYEFSDKDLVRGIWVKITIIHSDQKPTSIFLSTVPTKVEDGEVQLKGVSHLGSFDTTASPRNHQLILFYLRRF